MSELRREAIANQSRGFPPAMPPPGMRRTALGGRKRDYTPIPSNKYFDTKEIIHTVRGDFCAYSRGSEGPLVVCLHGGGFSALSWAVFASHLTADAVCQVMAFDQRGHGETSTDDNSDLRIDVLAADVGVVIATKYGPDPPPIVLLGHSMGGAVAVHAAYSCMVPSLIGLIVVDVVEGTALEALSGMKAFLHGRPRVFRSLEHAIEWSIRSGQIKNAESARVSMIGQVKPVTLTTADKTAASSTMTFNDSIAEEEHADETARQEVSRSESTQKADSPVAHDWRIDLESTEQFWKGWFQGLSTKFLDIHTPKMLLLAGVDRLDKPLSIGQMQGKFQMQVIGHVGHVVHEDSPDKVADVVATFLVRNKFAEPGEFFTRTFPAC